MAYNPDSVGRISLIKEGGSGDIKYKLNFNFLSSLHVYIVNKICVCTGHFSNLL
jgi:hypothetical protein